MKKLSCFCVIAAFAITPVSLFAESAPSRDKKTANDESLQETVSGTVVDETDGQPLPGVNIVIKGRDTGTTSNSDGYFEIAVPSLNETLVFSYVGYETLEEPLNDRADLLIELSQSVILSDEVIVTALGIEREAYTLGYSTQKVNASDINTARSGNWINSLQGKVAGLNLQAAGTGVSSTTRITLRGESSLNLSRNEALVVIDGIPVQSGTTGNGSNSYLGTETPVDFGDGLGDLNPDDIESINVLKGPSAAALYGSRAANGAIIITTKSGSGQEGIGVTYNAGLTFDRITQWPDYQTEYGSGSRARLELDYYSFDSEDGRTANQSTHTWGLPFEGQEFYQYQPDAENAVPLPWSSRDFIKGFFETGVAHNHNLSISRSSDLGSFRLSLSNKQNDWIVPNTGSRANTIDLNSQIIITDDVQVRAIGKYISRKSDNLPAAGYGSQSPMYFFMWTNNSIDVTWLEDYWREEDVLQDNRVNRNSDNPYFQSYEQLDTQDRGRFVGSVTLDVDPTEETHLMLRVGMDEFGDFRTTTRPKSSVRYPLGMYREQNIDFREINSDFLFTYQPTMLNNLETEISAGGNYRSSNYRNTRITAEELVLGGIYNLGNSAARPDVANSLSKREMYSLYSIVTLGQRWWNLDLTARNDWSSTLPEDNNSYFYPSASLSVLVNEIVNLGETIDFAKLRFSVAQVGNDADPYRIDKYYSYSSFDANVSNPNTIPNQNLKPEIVTSYETGFDIRMFQGRMNFDATYYHSESVNQILNVPTDPATGFTSALLNAGQINNTGVELTASFIPVRKTNFQWRSTLNWSANRGKVVSLADGVDNYIIHSGISSRVTVEARPGERFGDIYGRGYVRSPEGEIVHDENGYPMLTTDIMKVGNAFPDWYGGFYNEVSYKGLTVGALFDFRKGGSAYSLTYAALSYSGKLTNSLEGRYDGNIELSGVMLDENGNYVPNTRQPTNIGYYYDAKYSRDNVEVNTLDGSFIKLREVRIGYDLPEHWLENLFLQTANVSVTGRNLYTWTSWGAFDPEAATMDGNTVYPGIETGQFPVTTSLSFNIQLSF